MKIIDKRDENAVEEDSKVVPMHPELTLVTGGKMPPGSDWLSILTPGTRFLTRPTAAFRAKNNVNPALMEEFTLFEITLGGMCHLTDRNGNHIMWCDPKIWCRSWDLVEILPPVEE